MEQPDINLVLGALDSLGVALADHDHQWTEGEREIDERAVEILAAPRGERSEYNCGYAAYEHKPAASSEPPKEHGEENEKIPKTK